MTGAKFHSRRGSKLDKDDILYVCEIKTNDSVAVYKKSSPQDFLSSTKCNNQLMHACCTRRYNNAPS